LYCYGCTSLTSLLDLPSCTELNCNDCTALIYLPDLPLCDWLNCRGCAALISLPDLLMCTDLNCNDIPHLTHITVTDKCDVSCDNSPIFGYNNDLYLYYTNECHNIIVSSVNNSHNYEQSIVDIIVGYL
jgi:hypothetical protein